MQARRTSEKHRGLFKDPEKCKKKGTKLTADLGEEESFRRIACPDTSEEEEEDLRRIEWKEGEIEGGRNDISCQRGKTRRHGGPCQRNR